MSSGAQGTVFVAGDLTRVNNMQSILSQVEYLWPRFWLFSSECLFIYFKSAHKWAGNIALGQSYMPCILGDGAIPGTTY